MDQNGLSPSAAFSQEIKVVKQQENTLITLSYFSDVSVVDLARRVNSSLQLPPLLLPPVQLQYQDLPVHLSLPLSTR